MRASELAALLAADAEGTAQFLLPNGKRKGHEWLVGGIDGSAGESLKICVTGSKAGVWKDFANDDDSGDLIGLWMAVRRVDLRQACTEAGKHLGVKENKIESPRRSYSKPSRENVSSVQNILHNWLTSVRKVSPASIAAYKVAQKKGALMFPYLRDGELVFAKYRAAPEKKFWTDADCEPCLFGWQAMPGDAREVTLCEGELDAMALYDYGYPALSVPFGGGKGDKQAWIEHEFERLSVYDTIYLALDQDPTGKEATNEIIRRLGRERCRIVRLPRKDGNACAMEGVDREEVYECFRTARTCDPPALHDPMDYMESTIDLMQVSPENESGIRLPWDAAGDRLILRMGEWSLWFGISGSGKTEIMGHITAHAMHEYKACVASLEFRPERWLRRLCRQISGESFPTTPRIRNVFAWLRGRLWLYAAQDQVDRKDLLETFRYASRRYGIQLFVIDNLAKCGIAEDDYNGQKDFADRISSFCRDELVHVALVHHSRKTERGESAPPDKFDAKGTGALTDMVDTAVAIWRNKPKEKRIAEKDFDDRHTEDEVRARPDCLLICCKQRNGEDEPRISLWFDRSSHQYRSNKNAVPKPLCGLAVVDGGN